MTDELGQLNARLRHLEDLEAIRRLITAIARGTDRFDTDLLRSAIFDDAVLDMGGKSPMSGREFAAALTPPAEPRPGRTHFVSNERIDLHGDSARSETYVLSCQDIIVDGLRKTRTRAGRYVDRFERRDGVWKLASRTLIDEWGRFDEVVEDFSPGSNKGRPAPQDLSYIL